MNADLFWIGEKPDAADQSRTARRLLRSGNAWTWRCSASRNEDTTGHNGKNGFLRSAATGGSSRYRDGMDNPVVYAGAIAMHSRAFRRRAG